MIYSPVLFWLIVVGFIISTIGAGFLATARILNDSQLEQLFATGHFSLEDSRLWNGPQVFLIISGVIVLLSMLYICSAIINVPVAVIFIFLPVLAILFGSVCIVSFKSESFKLNCINKFLIKIAAGKLATGFVRVKINAAGTAYTYLGSSIAFSCLLLRFFGVN